ncbi:MAG: N-carbamoylputrescine amidase [Candidatus Dadabacteria bacterium]|nr:MAG: N-carbamoylputrescine amidase [Candidatus Dadabacteria bacterium]
MARENTVCVAVVQSAFEDDTEANVSRVEELIFDACGQGAMIVVLPELFEGPYFCKTEDESAFDCARPVDGHPTVERFRQLARELEIVLPVSFFERDGQAYYNSVAMVDAGGELLGVYRKSHIPDGPGYQEKFYFRPGDTGFRVWKTRYGSVGVGICWDQWFPEAARAMVLAGADLLVYPSAIGSEPAEPQLDTREPWQRVMIGHAVANAIPVAAANRTGTENGQHFYGHSFIANERGDTVAQLGDGEEGVRVATFDLAKVRRYRASFGFFRDRRPELYGALVATTAPPNGE